MSALSPDVAPPLRRPATVPVGEFAGSTAGWPAVRWANWFRLRPAERRESPCSVHRGRPHVEIDRLTRHGAAEQILCSVGHGRPKGLVSGRRRLWAFSPSICHRPSIEAPRPVLSLVRSHRSRESLARRRQCFDCRCLEIWAQTHAGVSLIAASVAGSFGFIYFTLAEGWFLGML